MTKLLTDANGNQTDWNYDALGRVREMLYPTDGAHRQTVSYAAYEADRPTRITFIEDAASPASLSWDLTYDDRGRLVTRAADTDFIGDLELFGGTTQSFVYDDLGHMIRATDTNPDYPDETDVTVHFTYDSLGRVIEENQPRDIDSSLVDHIVRSHYDGGGFRTQLDFPDAAGSAYQITYVPDSLGRLETIQAPTDPSDPTSTLVDLVTYDYVGSHVWSRRYRNGAELRMYDDGAVGHDPWDAVGRPTALRTVDPTTPPNDIVITDFRYGYDRVGNLNHEQRIHEKTSDDPLTHRTRAYATDLQRRLTAWKEGSIEAGTITPTTLDPLAQVEDPTDAERWELDPVGNWHKRWQHFPEPPDATEFTPNELNQYDAIDPDGPNGPEPAATLTYDWLGQLRQDDTRSLWNQENQRYLWDAFGRLTKITDTDTQPEVIAEYRYDALNRRIEKHTPGTIDPTTRYVYDGWRAIEERAPAATGPGWVVRARYGFGRTLDGVLWMDRDVARDPQDAPDPYNGAPNDTIESRFFAHHDLVGSVVALTEDATSGPVTVTERFTYNAYGNVTAWWTPTWSGTQYPGPGDVRSKVGLPYLYTGQRYDPEAGLLYCKNRFNDPHSGRFLSRDPMGPHGGLNLYEYAASNPSMYTDPLGLAPESHGANQLYYQERQNAKENESLFWAGMSRRKLYEFEEIERDDNGTIRAKGVPLDELDQSRCRSFGICKNASAYEMMMFAMGVREFTEQEYIDFARRTVPEGEMAPASHWMVMSIGKESQWWIQAKAGPRRFMLEAWGQTLNIGTGPTWISEGLQFAVYDDQEPLFGSHTVEAATLIPILKMAKFFRLLKLLKAQRSIRRAEVLEKLAERTDLYHRAPTFLVDDIDKMGHVFKVTGGDGVTRTLVQMPAVVDGKAGRVEWLLGPKGLEHQRFMEGGSISGVPNVP